MPAFKTRAGCGKISNFGYDFDEVGGTEVDDAEVAERLRNHFQFEEVGIVKRETMSAPVATKIDFDDLPDGPMVVGRGATVEQAFPNDPVPVPAPKVYYDGSLPGKRKGRQPFPRDAEGNIIRPEKANG